MRHYKRTCKNIEKTLEELVNSYKQSFESAIRKNHPVQISKVKLNKAMTVVHVWWDVPFLSFGELKKEEKLEVDEMNRVIELKLNQSIPFLRSKLTKIVGLKYAPEIRFYRDRKCEDMIDYRESIMNLTNQDKSQGLLNEAFHEINQEKKPLSYEQKERINNQYEKELEEILNSVDNPEERKELEKLNRSIREKNPQELKKEFFGAAERIEIDDENKNKLLEDMKSLGQFNPNNNPQMMTAKKNKPRNPLEMNTFTPKDKVGQKMIKERDKLLNSMGLNVKDFKGNNNQVNQIDVNSEIINFAKNYEYEIPSKALDERNRGIKDALKDYANLNNPTKKKEKDPLKKVVKEGNINKPNKEREHHKKKRKKSEEFWDNLEDYYDK